MILLGYLLTIIGLFVTLVGIEHKFDSKLEVTDGHKMVEIANGKRIVTQEIKFRDGFVDDNGNAIPAIKFLAIEDVTKGELER